MGLQHFPNDTTTDGHKTRRDETWTDLVSSFIFTYWSRKPQDKGSVLTKSRDFVMPRLRCHKKRNVVKVTLTLGWEFVIFNLGGGKSQKSLETVLSSFMTRPNSKRSGSVITGRGVFDTTGKHAVDGVGAADEQRDVMCE